MNYYSDIKQVKNGDLIRFIIVKKEGEFDCYDSQKSTERLIQSSNGLEKANVCLCGLSSQTLYLSDQYPASLIEILVAFYQGCTF